MQPTHSLFLPSETDTTRLGHNLAARLEPGDTLLLRGPIGAGKTHLARAIITALLAAPEHVPSPTYTLVQTYQGRSFPIWHADLYRLGDSSELIELGLTDAMDSALVLLEWPDRLPPDMAPAEALGIDLKVEHNGRRVELACTGSWASRLKDLAHV